MEEYEEAEGAVWRQSIACNDYISHLFFLLKNKYGNSKSADGYIKDLLKSKILHKCKTEDDFFLVDINYYDQDDELQLLIFDFSYTQYLGDKFYNKLRHEIFVFIEKTLHCQNQNYLPQLLTSLTRGVVIWSNTWELEQQEAKLVLFQSVYNQINQSLNLLQKYIDQNQIKIKTSANLKNILLDAEAIVKKQIYSLQ